MMSSLRRGRAGELPESPKKTQKRFKHTERERDRGKRGEGKGEREVEVRRPKHGNKSTIQVFGAALTGGRMARGGGGGGDGGSGGEQVHLKGRTIKRRRTR